MTKKNNMTDILKLLLLKQKLNSGVLIELCPVKRICWRANPPTSQKQGFCRYGQVNMKSSGWALSSMTDAPWERGIWTQTCTCRGRDIFTMRRWMQRLKWCIYKPRKTRIARKALETWPGTDSSFTALRRKNCADTMILDFKPLELWDNQFLLFKLPGLCSLLWQLQKTNTLVNQLGT